MPDEPPIPPAAELDAVRWLALCERVVPDLPGSLAKSEFANLKTAYGESHRAYHNAEHILECLERLDEVRDRVERPDEIEVALWLHDAIYSTRRKDSESRSAEWAVRILESGGAAAEVVERVEAMIMATLHTGSAPFPDAEWLVDIDLSILGRDAERFDRYESDVRREYRWVPGPLFRKGRRDMLTAFRARERIYGTQLFHEAYDAQARINLDRSIARLSGS